MGKTNFIEMYDSTYLQSENRRATVRYRCNPTNPSRAFFANSSKSVDAGVLDISQGGIGLILGSHVEPGTLLRIEIGNGEDAALVELVATVAYATQLENGKWRCGCQWLRELTKEELFVLK